MFSFRYIFDLMDKSWWYDTSKILRVKLRKERHLVKEDSISQKHETRNWKECQQNASFSMPDVDADRRHKDLSSQCYSLKYARVVL